MADEWSGGGARDGSPAPDPAAGSEAAGGISFAAFVVSLAHTAAVHFGDIPDPASGVTAEPNLEAAGQMIEILHLLEQKTRGNLSAEERQLLEQLLYELRMRYADARQPVSRIIQP